MKDLLRIANTQAFWGDSGNAAARMVHLEPDVDYVTMDYLSELSLSIMASQREKDAASGYAKDFIAVVHSLIPYWNQGGKAKLIANAGGLNPIGCAEACVKALKEDLRRPMKIAIISGDDVLPILKKDSHSPNYNNMENGASLESVLKELTTANAYFGAKEIAQSLIEGADIVITGRIADPSLTVGPCAAHFKWDWKDYDALAGATVAGHLIECGTQVTGGMSTDWMHLFNPIDIGFPIVEVNEKGHCLVTKPRYTSGKVTEETVKEQLLYEIGDPARYLSPDVTVSFLGLQVSNEGKDRVSVIGAKGFLPPATLKVSASYRAGYKAEGMLTILGPDAAAKARRCGELIIEKVRQAGYSLHRTLIECLGNNDVVPGVLPAPEGLLECVLRVAVEDPRKEALELFTKEIAPLVTSGPQGVVGYASGRPKIRPVFGYWPCLIEKSLVQSKIEWRETG